MGSDCDDQRRALVVGKQQRDVLTRAGGRKYHRLETEALDAIEPGRTTVAISVDDDFGATAQGGIGDRVHVADDDGRQVAALEQRIGAAIDADQHRSVFAKVGTKRLQVFAIVVTPHDDEHLLAVEVGANVGDADAVQQQVTLATQVLHGVRGERLELYGEAGPGLGHRELDTLCRLYLAGRHHSIACIQVRAIEPDDVAFLDVGEHGRTDPVDQCDALRHQDLGPEIRVAAADARRRVHDGDHAAFDERLGGDAIEVDVIDDRDVARAQPLGELLRSPV